MRKRVWIWLVMWLLALTGISFYGGTVSYGLFFALTGIPFVSFVYLLCVFLRFKIYQEVESRDIICGQAMPYYFVLRNEDWFGFAGVRVKMFPDFSYVENMPENVEYELLPGDEFVYRTQVVCKYRGNYEIGIKEVLITDFFGIFCFKYPIVSTIHAIVLPKLVELAEISAMREMPVVRQREYMYAQKEPDVVVRDYVQGDSQRKIHWKASARTQKWKVRTDTGEEKQKIRIFLDTKRYSRKQKDYLPLESTLIETVLALAMFFAKRCVPVSVHCGQEEAKRVEVTEMRNFEELYRVLSQLPFQEEEEPFYSMERLRQQGDWNEAEGIILVLHEWTDEMMRLSEEISAGGLFVLAYVVTQENLEGYVKQNTDRRKLVVFPADANLEEVL